MADEEIVVKLTVDPSGVADGMEEAAAEVAAGQDAIKASSAAAAGSVKEAAVAVAASEEAAASRIKDMVAASLAAAAANQQNTISQRALREASQGYTAASAEQLAAAEALRAAQVAQMAPIGEYLGAEAAATAETLANTAATAENAAAQGVLNDKIASGAAVREYSALVDEALSGNYRRMTGTVAVLGNRLGIMQVLFSTTGAVIAASAAAIGVLVAGFIKGSEEAAQFQKAILETGDASGTTVGQLREMARNMDDAVTTMGKAKDVLLEVAGTGRFAGDQLEMIGKAAIDMAEVTGISTKQAVAEMVKLQDEPVKAAMKLNEQYHFLTAGIFDEIQALQEQGQKEQAAAVAQDALATAFGDRVKAMTDQEGSLQRFFHSVAQGASSMWDNIKGIGRPDTAQEQLEKIGAQITALQEQAANYGKGSYAADAAADQLKALETKRDALLGQIAAEKKTAGDDADEQKRTQAYIDASRAIQESTDALDKNARKQEEINKLNEEFKAIAAVDPGKLKSMGVVEGPKGDFSGGEYDVLYKAIEAKYKTHVANMKTMDDEQLREMEAKEKVSYDARDQFELEFWKQKLTTVKAGTAEYANAYAKMLEAQQRVDTKARESARTQEQIAESQQQTALAMEEESVRQKAALGEISVSTEYQQLQDLENRKYALQKQSLDRELALYTQGSSAYNGVLLKEQQALSAHEQAVQKIEDQAVQAQVARFKNMIAPVNQAIQTSINGIIQGTTSAKQAMANLALSIVDEFIAKGVEMLTNWVATEAAKTSATTSATGTRSSIMAAATIKDRATVTAQSVADITSYAAVAAAAAASSVAYIPVVGWLMAPGVAAETFAATEAYAGIAAAEGGWDDVGASPRLTMLHPHEMVLPQPLAQGVREMVKGGAQGSGGEGSALPPVHFHMMDSAGIYDVLRRNPRLLADALGHAARRSGGPTR